MMLGGGLIERVNVRSTGVWKIPDNFAFEKAAAVPVNYGTTWFALHQRGNLQSGETVLVTGAAGGTGSAAIQLAKATGAMVIAIAGGAEKTKQAEFLGADHVIDHQINSDWVDEVRELSNGGVDIAYDPVGGDTTHQVRRCMAGWLTSHYWVCCWDTRFTHQSYASQNYSVVGVHWGASLGRDPQSLNNQMHSIIELAEKGFVDPLIFKPYEFENGAVAIQDLADRKTWEKVIVRVG